MRLLIARLGELASTAGLRSLSLRSLVEPLLALRTQLRENGRYDVADALRAAMHTGGIQIEDTPDGPRWTTAP
jgi:cysteinyl-tRNA synthetase